MSAFSHRVWRLVEERGSRNNSYSVGLLVTSKIGRETRNNFLFDPRKLLFAGGGVRGLVLGTLGYSAASRACAL